MDGNDRERVAIHEAAHAVINVVLDIRFRYVTIIPRSATSAGHVMGYGTWGGLRYSGDWMREAIADAAGIIAEDLQYGADAGGSRPNREWLRKQLVRDAGRTDMKNLRRVTQLAYMHEHLEPGWSAHPLYDDDTPLDLAKRAWRKAILMVGVHWEAIEDVAYELLVIKPTLSADEVREVMETGGSVPLPEDEVLECLDSAEHWSPWFVQYSRLKWEPGSRWYERLRADVARHAAEVARHKAKSGRTD
jgi:ATP-dependent Zn protease